VLSSLIIGFFVCAFSLVLSQTPKKMIPGMDDVIFKVEAAAETPVIPVEWAQFRDGYQTGICYQRATQPDHPLLIFLHDSRWYGQQFDPLFPRLVDYGNLLAPNLRGHGPLAAHRGEIDYIGQFEDDIADLIDLYARPGQKLCWPVTALVAAWRFGFWRENIAIKCTLRSYWPLLFTIMRRPCGQMLGDGHIRWIAGSLACHF
jgi:hypothetical protein